MKKIYIFLIGLVLFIYVVTHPNNVKRKQFHQPYKPPDPVAPGVRRLPEEIEAELKQVEANLDKLASVTIKFCVIYFLKIARTTILSIFMFQVTRRCYVA